MPRKIEVITPIVTPFTKTQHVDLDGTQTLLKYIEPHTDGVFPNGTTGEFPALSPQERQNIAQLSVDVFGPDRTIVHVGAPSAYQAIDHLHRAEAVGARRFAAITPYYLTAPDSAIIDYYQQLRDATDGSLYAYVFPEVACSDISPSLLAKLQDIGIEGVKTSGAASARIEDYLCAAPGMQLWTGNDADSIHLVAAGGKGIVSGVSGVAPRSFAALRAAINNEVPQEIESAQQIVLQLVKALGPSIANLKYGLEHLSLPSGPTRMAIGQPTTQSKIAIEEALLAAKTAYGAA